MYVFAPNQTVETFPYSIGNLRRDNPTTSFPRNPSDELLAQWNVFPVVRQDPPSFNSATQDLNQVNPTLTNNQWLQTWSVTAATSDEISERTAVASSDVRNQRNHKLKTCDWTQMADSPLASDKKTEWATYRQELRDISSASGFPHTMAWPTIPS